MNDNKPIIRTENLSKCFKGKIHALDNVNAEINRGEVIVIIGPNECVQ